MLEDVIKRLEELSGKLVDESTNQKQEDRNKYMAVLAEMSNEFELEWDISKLRVDYQDGYYERVMIYSNQSYHALYCANRKQPNDTWKTVDCNVKTSYDLDNNNDFNALRETMSSLKITSKAYTDHSRFSHYMNKLYGCFSDKIKSEAKLALIRHLKTSAEQTKELEMVMDCIANGVIELEHSKYVASFDGNTKDVDKMTIVSNGTGTYTCTMYNNNIMVSQSKRVNSSTLSSVIYTMLGLNHFLSL